MTSLSSSRRLGSLTVLVVGTLVAIAESFKQLVTLYLHRFVVAARETSGRRPFEPLGRCPRHACLAIGRPSRIIDVDRAVRTMINAGIERVTVCHDGALSLSGELYIENVTVDMGRSGVVTSLKEGFIRDEGSQPDAVFVLGSDPSPLLYTASALQLPSCVDSALLYYSELIPVYSLHPSDVFLAISMFQSKTQRFGR